jgi:hypothetical protein
MNEVTDENDYDHDYDYEVRAPTIAALSNTQRNGLSP